MVYKVYSSYSPITKTSTGWDRIFIDQRSINNIRQMSNKVKNFLSKMVSNKGTITKVSMLVCLLEIEEYVGPQ